MYEPEHNRTLVVALAPKQTIDIKEEYEKRLDWIKDVEGMKDEYEEWLAGDLEDNLLKFALQHFGQEIFFLDHEGQRFKYGDCKSSPIAQSTNCY